MVSIDRTLETIFGKFGEISKPQRKFLKELFEILPCIRGRNNFKNPSRYSKYNSL